MNASEGDFSGPIAIGSSGLAMLRRAHRLYDCDERALLPRGFQWRTADRLIGLGLLRVEYCETDRGTPVRCVMLTPAAEDVLASLTEREVSFRARGGAT